MRSIVYLSCLALVLVCSGCGEKNEDGKVLAHGRIELDEINLMSKVTGRITSLTVREGDKVKEGELIGYLDLYSKTKKDLERNENLAAKGAVSQEALENAQVAFRDQCLISPIDGVVLLQVMFQGDTVSPGQTIVTLGDLKKVYAKVYVPEKELGKVKLNQPADVSVDSFPDKVFSGRVIYISNLAEFTPKNVQTEEERARRVYAVKISVDNEKEELKPGMPCDAVIEVE